MDTQRTSKRILILGSTEHPPQVTTTAAWDNIPPELNVSDYDVVIINLSTLSDTTMPTMNEIGNRGSYNTLLGAETKEIIFIGDPRQNIAVGPGGGYLMSTFFLPDFLAIQSENGSTVKVVDDTFDFYFRNVESWQFACLNASDGFPRRSQNELPTKTHFGAIAVNSAGHLIAFTLQFTWHEAVPTTGYSLFSGLTITPGEQIAASALVTWLPSPTKISSTAAVNEILANLYDIRPQTKEPDWASAYKTPQERDARKELADLDDQLLQMQKRREAIEQNIQDHRKPVRLLYEDSDELEEAVLDAFETLGGTVQRTGKANRKDGRLIDPQGRHHILEIKGRKAGVKEEDVRQLHQWIADAQFAGERNLKGVLVYNPYRLEDPDTRTEIRPNDHAISSAKNQGYLILLSLQLFEAVQSYQRGNLDTATFWNNLHASSGLAQLPATKKEEA